MDTRLLSEQEIIDILGWPTMPDYELHQATAAAQLAKTDKEWVEWANGICTEHTMDNVLLPGRLRRKCDFCWQERKKEIGL